MTDQVNDVNQTEAALDENLEGDLQDTAPTAEEDAAAAEKDPKDEQIAQLQQQVREMDGRVGSERGHKLMLQKLIKELEKTEGTVNRDTLAEAAGVDRARLDGILDAPLVDDNDAFRKRAGAADRQLKAVAKVLKANGKDADEISEAYAALLQFDASERERFMNTPEDELGSFIIERVTEAEPRVKPIVAAKGNVLDALDISQKRIAELEAENAQLKSKGQPKEQRVPLGGSDPATAARPRQPGGSFYDGV
jgi:hypothetical protein